VTGRRTLRVLAAVTVFGTCYGQATLEHSEWYAFSGDRAGSQTARFAQPISSVILYPMLAISGVFAPLEAMPDGLQTIAGVLPLTHAVSLLQGAWAGESWMDHLVNVGMLGLTIVLCTALASRIFRWE